MSLGTWLAFAGALLVALAVPGPDFVLVVHAATRGLRAGLRTAGGIITGLCLHAGLAIAGLTTLLATLPGVLTALRFAGAAVLLWLGIAMLRDWKTAPGEHPVPGAGGYLRGLLVNATNPKALLFFAAVLPQFIGTGDGRFGRTVVLALTVVLGSALWWTGTVLVLRKLGAGRFPAAGRFGTLAGGLTLTGLAIALAAVALAS